VFKVEKLDLDTIQDSGCFLFSELYYPTNFFFPLLLFCLLCFFYLRIAKVSFWIRSVSDDLMIKISPFYSVSLFISLVFMITIRRFTIKLHWKRWWEIEQSSRHFFHNPSFLQFVVKKTLLWEFNSDAWDILSPAEQTEGWMTSIGSKKKQRPWSFDIPFFSLLFSKKPCFEILGQLFGTIPPALTDGQLTTVWMILMLFCEWFWFWGWACCTFQSLLYKFVVTWPLEMLVLARF
jgi:hypothetical protein